MEKEALATKKNSKSSSVFTNSCQGLTSIWLKSFGSSFSQVSSTKKQPKPRTSKAFQVFCQRGGFNTFHIKDKKLVSSELFLDL